MVKLQMVKAIILVDGRLSHMLVIMAKNVTLVWRIIDAFWKCQMTIYLD